MWMQRDESPSASTLARDGRSTLELLEEQILAQGPACPPELLDAYEELREAFRKPLA